MSASLDYSDFDTIREPLLESLIRLINNMALPDLTFNGGHFRQNTLYVDKQANDLFFVPHENNNSLTFEMRNITVHFRSNNFRYSLLTIPLNGFLDAYMSEVHFLVNV